MNPINKFFDSAKLHPNLIAIASARFEMSYSDLADTANRFATKFLLAGIKKGSVVALKARPEIEAVSMIAIMQLGAISLRGSQQILNSYSSQIEYLITDDAMLTPAGINVIDINNDFLRTLGGLIPTTEIVDMSSDEICRIVFSSGTTGIPKGVEFSVSYLEKRIQSAFNNWIRKPPFMSFLGLDTVTGFQTFFWALFNSETYFYFATPEVNLETIKKYHIVTIKSSSSRLKDFLNECSKQKIEKLPIDTIQVAGSLLTKSLALKCRELLKVHPIYLYGSTEVGTVTRGEFKFIETANVGSQVNDVELEIVDASGSQVGADLEGLIRFRKSGMPLQYWNSNYANTYSGFKSDWFYSGDYGLLTASGELIIRGRKDDLVNAGGAKFNLLELDIWLNESGLFDEACSFQFLDEDSETCIGIAYVTKDEIPPEIIVNRIEDFSSGLNVRSLLRINELPRNQLGKIERLSLASLAEGI